MKKKEFSNLPSTETPITAENLNEMQSNIEESCIIVSPTEPTTNEKVWIQKGKNLFNKNSGIVLGSFINSDGGIGTDSALFYQSTYIPVLPNTEYTISSSTGEPHRIAEYDNNKTFIKRSLNSNSYTKYTILTSSNCYFLRISCNISNLDSIQLEQGSTATDYEEFIYPNIYTGNNGSYEKLITENDVVVSSTAPSSGGVWIQKGKNLFNKNTVINGYYWNAGGNLVASASASAGDFMQLKVGETYYSNKTISIVYFDENKNPIKLTSTFSGKFIAEYPFAKANPYTTDVDTLQIEQGSIATEYEAYVKRKINVDGEEFLDVEKVNNNMNYSTEEQVIGTWTKSDGTRVPLYRKFVTGTTPTAANKTTYATVELDIAENVDFALIEKAYIPYAEGNNVMLPYMLHETSSSTYTDIKAYTNNNKVAITSNFPYFNSKTVVAIVIYTKSTD